MTNLGLDTLTDDQIVELARAIAAEMANRSPDVVDAAKAAVAAATARAINSQDKIWTQKKWLATMLREQVGRGWSINVWRAPTSDEVRVYLETYGDDKRGRASLKYCYYVTGGAQHPPGALTVHAGSRAEKFDHPRLIKIIAAHAAALFPNGARIDCDEAARTKYDIPADPQDLTDAIAEIEAAESARAARDEFRAAARRECWSAHDAERDRLRAAAGLPADAGLMDPRDIYDALTPLREAAQTAFDAAMAGYDAQHGATK